MKLNKKRMMSLRNETLIAFIMCVEEDLFVISIARYNDLINEENQWNHEKLSRETKGDLVEIIITLLDEEK